MLETIIAIAGLLNGADKNSPNTRKKSPKKSEWQPPKDMDEYFARYGHKFPPIESVTRVSEDKLSPKQAEMRRNCSN